MTQLHPSQMVDLVNFEHSLDAKRSGKEKMAGEVKSEAAGDRDWINRNSHRLLQSIHLGSEFFKSRFGSGRGNISEPAHN